MNYDSDFNMLLVHELGLTCTMHDILVNTKLCLPSKKSTVDPTRLTWSNLVNMWKILVFFETECYNLALYKNFFHEILRITGANRGTGHIFMSRAPILFFQPSNSARGLWLVGWSYCVILAPCDPGSALVTLHMTGLLSSQCQEFQVRVMDLQCTSASSKCEICCVLVLTVLVVPTCMPPMHNSLPWGQL